MDNYQKEIFISPLTTFFLLFQQFRLYWRWGCNKEAHGTVLVIIEVKSIVANIDVTFYAWNGRDIQIQKYMEFLTL